MELATIMLPAANPKKNFPRMIDQTDKKIVGITAKITTRLVRMIALRRPIFLRISSTAKDPMIRPRTPALDIVEFHLAA